MLFGVGCLRQDLRGVFVVCLIWLGVGPSISQSIIFQVSKIIDLFESFRVEHFNWILDFYFQSSDKKHLCLFFTNVCLVPEDIKILNICLQVASLP